MKTRDINTEAWRAPSVPEGSAVIFDEPGRVLDRKSEGGHCDVCFRAYHYTVTRGQYGGFTLRVKHGAGEESLRLQDEAIHGLRLLDSDARYFLLHALYTAHSEAKRAAEDATAAKFRQAHADGRLKRQKVRGQSAYKVWIESAPATQESRA
jgi:hypothetical protein